MYSIRDVPFEVIQDDIPDNSSQMYLTITFHRGLDSLDEAPIEAIFSEWLEIATKSEAIVYFGDDIELQGNEVLLYIDNGGQFHELVSPYIRDLLMRLHNYYPIVRVQIDEDLPGE